MNEKPGNDPLRRKPPIIDLPPGEVSRGGEAETAGTAIEPVASTGLGPEPFPRAGESERTAKAGERTEDTTVAPERILVPEPGLETGSGAPPPASAPAAEVEAVRKELDALLDGKPGSEPSGPPAAAASDELAAEPAASSAPLAPPPPARRGGAASALGAGLMGGLIGAGLVYGVTRYVPWGSSPDRPAEERLAALERRVAASPSTPAPISTVSPLEPRMAALERSVTQAGEEARAARAAAEAARVAASAGAAAPPGQPSAPPVDPALREAVATLNARLEDISNQTAASGAAAKEAADKVTAIDTRVSEGLAAGVAGLQAVNGAVASLRTDVSALRAALDALEGRAGDADKRSAALAGGLEKLSSELSRVSGDLQKVSPAAVQAGLRVVVAGRLEDALRTGSPPGPILSALEKLGTEPEALAALRPFGSTPPPSAGALAADWKPLAARLTSPPASGEPDSIAERVRRVFGKVVSVRAVGDGSGGDLPGLVSRIDAALARGALAEAASLWDQLPSSAKQETAEWSGRLKARLAAENAARRLVSTSLTGLDAATR